MHNHYTPAHTYKLDNSGLTRFICKHDYKHIWFEVDVKDNEVYRYCPRMWPIQNVRI